MKENVVEERDKVKFSDLIQLLNVLGSFTERLPFKFSYAVAKNIVLIKREVDVLSEAIKPDKEFMEYEKERLELCRVRARKAGDGEPLLKGNAFDIEDMEAFNKEFGVLREKYKEAIEHREEQVSGYNKMLEEEVEVKFHKIREEDFPEKISPSELMVMMPLLIEDVK